MNVEKYHCQKKGTDCECLCHWSNKCTLHHHTTTGYQKQLHTCDAGTAPPTPKPTVSPTASPTPAPTASLGSATRDNSVFGSSMVDFDLGCSRRHGGCPEGRDMSTKYTNLGVTFKDTKNVYTSWSKSPGFGGCNGPHSGWGNKPMSFTFTAPKSRVGFYYSGPNKDIYVSAFDSSNNLIKKFHITNNGGGRPDNSRFFGMKGSGITRVDVDGAGYIIDDLRWN